MPLPSPSSKITLRSGPATEAPVAQVNPTPTDPPMTLSQSWGGAPAVVLPNPRPEVTDSSTMIAFSGSSAPTTAPTPSGVIGPLGNAGRDNSATHAGGVLSALSS